MRFILSKELERKARPVLQVIASPRAALILTVLCAHLLTGTIRADTPSDPASVSIARVQQMPRLPAPYVLRDWRQVTRDYLDFVFDFTRQGEHLPTLRWLDGSRTMVWLPAYVGNPSGPEGINFLAALVSGSLAGLDMSSYRGHSWVDMATNFFSPPDGICLDWRDGRSGGSLWYDVLPNVLFFQLTAQYPGDASRDRLSFAIAERFYQACVALGASANPPALPDFDHTGFNLRQMRPFDNGQRIEPEGAAGIAWIEYMAWRKFQDPRFLAAADWCVSYLERKPQNANPLYEVLLPYAVITAARLNAEAGRSHDVAKLLNWCFEPGPAPQARPYWGVIVGNWNGFDVHGLTGSSTDGGGYGFTMNTFQYAGTLAPLCRYDARYARDLGKWLLNLANAARLFYPNAHPAERQSSHAWASRYDPKSVIAYEGLRRWKRNAELADDFRTRAGAIRRGSCQSTHFYRETPIDAQVLEETPVGDTLGLDHTWQLNLPENPERYLVIAAELALSDNSRNHVRFSYAAAPDGPFTEAFQITNAAKPCAVELPAALRGKLYLRAESLDRAPGRAAPDQLKVDAIAISYCSGTGPFAQGDDVVSFIDLVKNCTVPVVLYRPEKAATDLGLYGSSHVGMLGGIVRPTDVERILQWDLLQTDFFHATAEPTFLYYNPYDDQRSVTLDLGSEPREVYDLVTRSTLLPPAKGLVQLSLPPNAARVVVLRTPAKPGVASLPSSQP